MTPKNLKLLAVCLLTGISTHAWALESDRNQPIAIEADQGSLDQGNQSMRASGRPVQFGQQLEKDGMVKGQANEVRYASASGIVTLTGNARVERGGDMARGHSIVYNTRTEVYTVSGGDKGRVSVLIQPQNK